jgi:FixJ family two-component response regulator
MIAVVDDDTATCQSIQRLLWSHGIENLAFHSANAFLNFGKFTQFQCLILDIRMPGLSGLQLQDAMLKASILLPIIYITGYADDIKHVDLWKAGTVEILEKPFDEEVLISHVKAAVKIFG